MDDVIVLQNPLTILAKDPGVAERSNSASTVSSHIALVALLETDAEDMFGPEFIPGMEGRINL